MQENEKDIHNYAAVVASYLKKIETDADICEQNRKDLLRYATSLQDLAHGTQSKNLQVMHRIEKMLRKPFKQATKKDIEAIVSELRGNGNHTKWTTHKYLACLKRFYRWLYGMKPGRYPDCVDWIEFRAGKQNGVPTNRLTIEDYKKLIQAAQNPRDKFIVSALADLGCRISELGCMNIENIEDRGDYVLFQITESKTMIRSLPVKNTRPYLLEYLKVHPKPEPNQPLLMDKTGKRMEYACIRKALITTGRMAGISKPINPHHFRRSTATIFGQFFHENEMDAWFGWGKAKISNLYVSFSGQQLLETYNKFWESDKNILRQIICPHCKQCNEGVAQYCNTCKQPLLAKTILSKQQAEAEKDKGLIESALKDAEFGKELVNLLANFAEKRKIREMLAEARSKNNQQPF